MSFVATLIYGDDVHDCLSEGAEIRRLKDMITKVSNKHNGENELEFLNWLLDPVNYTILYFYSLDPTTNQIFLRHFNPIREIPFIRTCSYWLKIRICIWIP